MTQETMKLNRISDEKIVAKINLSKERKYESSGTSISTIDVYPILDVQIQADQLVLDSALKEKDKEIEKLRDEVFTLEGIRAVLHAETSSLKSQIEQKDKRIKKLDPFNLGGGL